MERGRSDRPLFIRIGVSTDCCEQMMEKAKKAANRATQKTRQKEFDPVIRCNAGEGLLLTLLPHDTSLHECPGNGEIGL